MQIRGAVLNQPRVWDFQTTDRKRVDMVSFDLYDETVGLVSCEMRVNGNSASLVPAKRDSVLCEVGRIKASKFAQSGFVLAVRGITPWTNAPRPIGNPADSVHVESLGTPGASPEKVGVPVSTATSRK